jgi:hypothetical protein
VIEQHKINFKSQWKNGWGMLFILIGCLAIILYFVYIKNDNDIRSLIGFVLIIFLIQALPQFALHLNYYTVNKDDVLRFDIDNQKIIFKHSGATIQFFLSDIKNVDMYKSFALAKKNMQFFTFDCYNHSVITLISGVKIIITSLLLPGELNLPIDKDKIKVHMSFFRWVSGESLQYSINKKLCDD